MKIEITKKQLTIAAITIAVLALSFTGGYFWGFDNGVESMQNPKGDGSHYYVEIRPSISDAADENLVYHSTTDCPSIQYGVKMDRYGYAYEYNNSKIYPYHFCPKCMDSQLIEDCDERIWAAFSAKQSK